MILKNKTSMEIRKGLYTTLATLLLGTAGTNCGKLDVTDSISQIEHLCKDGLQYDEKDKATRRLIHIFRHYDPEAENNPIYKEMAIDFMEKSENLGYKLNESAYTLSMIGDCKTTNITPELIKMTLYQLENYGPLYGPLKNCEK